LFTQRFQGLQNGYARIHHGGKLAGKNDQVFRLDFFPPLGLEDFLKTDSFSSEMLKMIKLRLRSSATITIHFPQRSFR
jgi:hypothetical protein